MGPIDVKGIPHMTICSALKYAPKYGIWDAYLSVLNMVQWGIPEKILQNAIQIQIFETLIEYKQ